MVVSIDFLKAMRPMVETKYSERRAAERVPAYGDLFIKRLSDGPEKNFYANLFNKSTLGAGVFITAPLSQGAECEISCDAHWEGCRKAVVRWCSPVAVDLYRAGFSFA